LERIDNTYRLRRTIEEVQVPGTIQEVILSRVDRLAREAKEAMQLASVVGREFTARVLGRISDLDTQLPAVLADLSALALIYEKARFPELAYMFKHALIHDVAYATLLADRRRALHRLVGAAIEELYADRLTEHYETLAHHFTEGQEWDKALEYLEKAGDKAAAAYANTDALGFYGRALDVCETLGAQAVPASASLAAKRAFVNFLVGEVPAAVADFDRMVEAARQLGSRSLEGTALGYRGLMEVWNNDWDQAETTLRTAWVVIEEGFEEVRPIVTVGLVFLFFTSNRLPEAEPLLTTDLKPEAMPDPFTQGFWNMTLGFLEYWWGRPSESLRVLRQVPEAAARLITIRLWNWWPQSLALATKGEYEAALTLLDEMRSTGERAGDVLLRPRILNTVGWIYGELEDPGRALDWNRESVEIATAPGFPDFDVGMHARVNVGDNLVALGRPEEAEAEFRAVEAVIRDPKPHERWMVWRYSQHLFHSYGELWLARGDVERALCYADECLEVAEYNASRKNIIKGRRLRGQVFMAQGRLDEAVQELSAALDIAGEVGNPPQLWKTHAAIGELRWAQGRPEEAHRAYREALSIIEGVAASITDERIRETFLQSKHAEGIRRAAEAFS
jgi:tetratricopeptide (TPR) repeat protein